MIYDHPDFYVPNLATFQNGNSYLGSFHGLRFRLQPETQGEEPAIQCLTWYGEYCLEKSQVVSRAAFPLSEEGCRQMLDWLDGEFKKMKQAQSASK